jgi:hypothetical protein
MKHFAHIVDLITTGKLADALATNRRAVVSCGLQAVGEFGALIDPDHDDSPLVIGDAGASEINVLVARFADAVDADLPIAAVGDGGTVEFNWIDVILPILIDLIKKWLDG